jgi:hypothetical protein
MKWKDIKDTDVPEWLREKPEMLEVAYVATHELAGARMEVKNLKEHVTLMHRLLNVVIDDILFLTNGRVSTLRDHHDRSRYNEWADYDN